MFKNNVLKTFFAINEKFEQSIRNFEKFDFHDDNYFKHHSYSKFNADSNAKNIFNFIQYILSYFIMIKKSLFE